MQQSLSITARIKQVVQALEPRAELILYGSQARNDTREEPDYDILILLPYPVDLQKEQLFRHRLFDV